MKVKDLQVGKNYKYISHLSGILLDTARYIGPIWYFADDPRCEFENQDGERFRLLHREVEQIKELNPLEKLKYGS